MRRHMTVMLVGVIAASAMLAGCQQKFTRERYDTIYCGMAQKEVELTLGEPAARFSDSESYIHEKPFYKAIIKYSDGRVIDKSWSDEKQIGDMPDNKAKPAATAVPQGQTTVVVQ